MKNFRNIIINSSILFIVASVVQMTLHECGHFIAALLIHAKNVTLYHNYVSAQTKGMPLLQCVFYAGAGPFVSLVIGACFHFICTRQKKRNLLFLLNLYLTVVGYIAFFGYLMVAPFFTYGDTGYIFRALNFPIWLIGLIAVMGGLALYIIMGKLMRFFVELGTAHIIADWASRRIFIRSLIQYPLYIGIVITTLLNLPTPTLLSLIYPICSPFSIMWADGKGVSKVYPADNMNTDISAISRIQPVWLIILFLIIVMNRLLVYGIAVN
ncbi:MAG: hypothetical protein V4553_05815 [Bacteroidota bacterium]